MTSAASGLSPTTRRKGRPRESGAVVIAPGRLESRSMPLAEAAKRAGEECRMPGIGAFGRDGREDGCTIAGARGAALGCASPHGGERTAVLVKVAVGELIASGKPREVHLIASLLWMTDDTVLWKGHGTNSGGRLYRNIPVNTSLLGQGWHEPAWASDISSRSESSQAGRNRLEQPSGVRSRECRLPEGLVCLEVHGEIRRVPDGKLLGEGLDQHQLVIVDVEGVDGTVGR